MILLVAKRLVTGLGLIFVMLHAVPGDPARQLLSGDSGVQVTPEALKVTRERLGLDLSLPVQYWHYLTGVFRLDFGSSFRDDSPVMSLVAQRLPNTIELVLLGVLLALLIGIPLGSLAARRGGAIDSLVSVGTSVGLSVPVYVVGAVFVFFFAVTHPWLPAGGYVSFREDPVGHLERTLLPTVALSLGITATIARMCRSAVLENSRQDWVRTAQSWGMGKRRVFRRYVLRNSLTPVATVTALQIGTLLGSTVLVEKIFDWPGVCLLLVDSVTARDYPVVQGIVIVLSAVFIFINIMTDVLYGYLDPRARQS
jgi:peptide/nickel transport system permease protein